VDAGCLCGPIVPIITLSRFIFAITLVNWVLEYLPCVVSVHATVMHSRLSRFKRVLYCMPGKPEGVLDDSWLAVCDTGPVQQGGKERRR
jgi:hypothetical protein